MQRLPVETVTVKDISRIVMRNTFLHMLSIRPIRRKTKQTCQKWLKAHSGTEGLSRVLALVPP
jgi:hypothetical protein